MNRLRDGIERILLDREVIKKRVAEIGAEITRAYAGKDLLMVCILRGAAVFFADLIREIDLPVRTDFIAVSSYGEGTRSSGEVRLVKDLDTVIEGLDVLIVEDIIDTGYTLKYIKNIFMQRKPASVRICALLDKPDRRETDTEGDHIGFTIPDLFVVGYGLDYAERYRNLADICVLSPEVAE